MNGGNLRGATRHHHETNTCDECSQGIGTHEPVVCGGKQYHLHCVDNILEKYNSMALTSNKFSAAADLLLRLSVESTPRVLRETERPIVDVAIKILQDLSYDLKHGMIVNKEQE